MKKTTFINVQNRFHPQPLVLLICGILFALVAISLPAAETKTPTVLVLRGGTVFDSLKGEMLPDQTIIIRGDQIEQVGPRASVSKLPKGAKIINARGKFIIPGLMDAHAHIVFHQPANAHVTGDETFPLFLAAGVTSIRSTGDSLPPQKLLQRFGETHPERSPRLFMCSALIDGPTPFHRDMSWSLPNPNDVPAYVDDMAGWGVTTLKIYVGTQREVGRRVIEEGHKHGLMVTGHLLSYSAQDASDDGIDCIEHIVSTLIFMVPKDQAVNQENVIKMDFNNPRAQDLIQRYLKNHTRVDPTLAIYRNAILLPDAESEQQKRDDALVPARLKRVWDRSLIHSSCTPENFDKRRNEFKRYQELVGVLYRAGVTILAGTDTQETQCPAGFSLLQELEMLAESGMPPAAVLQSATINNAGAVKQEAHLGSITPGKFADLVILSANPLTDIHNVRKIEKIIHLGIVCDPKELLKLVPRE